MRREEIRRRINETRSEVLKEEQQALRDLEGLKKLFWRGRLETEVLGKSEINHEEVQAQIDSKVENWKSLKKFLDETNTPMDIEELINKIDGKTGKEGWLI